MKIKEIISEAPAGDIGHAVGHTANAAAKGIGAVAGAVAGAPKRIAKGIKSGAAAFDKLMSPSQWFSGNGDKADTDDNDSNKTNVTTVAQYIDSLNAVAQGLTPNAKDIANLKQLPAKQGFSPEEQEVLKTAYSGHRLTPQQVAIIKQITAKL
jgi:hypothetical protein